MPTWQQWSGFSEPIVSDAMVDPSGETFIADLGVRSFWLPQAEALFDVCIVDTDAQSYVIHTLKSVLFGTEIGIITCTLNSDLSPLK